MRSLTVLVIVLLAFAGLAGAATKPTMRVVPSTVHRGGQVTFVGAHWPKFTKVQLLLGRPNSEATRFSTVSTDGKGKFNYTFPIKRTAPTGRYVVLACRKQCAIKVSRNMTIVK